jgi:hypothetical protein
MPVFNNALAGAAGSGGAAGYKIERSLRFDSDDSAHLTKVFGGADRKKWTLSFWYKPALQNTNNRRQIFTAENGSVASILNFRDSDDSFEMYHYNGSSLSFQICSAASFRDPSAWYHFVVAWDTTQTTNTDRVKVWCNGERITQWKIANWPAQNIDYVLWNDNNVTHRIGRDTSHYLSGYLAEMHFIDSIVKDETAFGEYDDDGIWRPIEYTGIYNSTSAPLGVNGFYLDFSDNSSDAALGDDRSRPDYNKLAGALTTTTGSGNFYSNTNPNRAFDGNTSNDVYGGWTQAGDDSNLIWSPPSGSYSVSSSLRVYAGYYSTIYVNGVSKATGNASNNSAWVTLAHTGAITEIKVENTTNDNVARISAIEIDGTVLVSNAWTVNNLTAAISTPPFSWDGGTLNLSATGGSGNAGGYKDAYFLLPATGSHSWDMVLNTDGNTGFWFSDTSSASNTHPNQQSGNFIGLRNNGGGNAATGGSGFGSGTVSMPTNAMDGDPRWYFTIDRANGSGTVKAGPSGSPYSFTIPTTGDVYFHVNAYGAYQFDLASGDSSDIDSLIDSPTNYKADSGNNGGNYASWNPLTNKGVVTTSNGNLTANATNSGFGYTLSTIAVSSGKYYCEISFEGTMAHSVNYNYIGIVPTDSAANYTGQDIFRANGALSIDSNSSVIRGTIGTGGGETNNTYQSSYGFDENDTIGIAIDCDTPQVTFYKNGTSIGTFPHTMQSNKSWVLFVNDWANGADFTGYILNAGQRPFSYTPPTGYKSLCTQNLDDPPIADGSKYFDAKLYTGNGSGLQVGGSKPSENATVVGGTISNPGNAFNGSGANWANLTATTTSTAAHVDFAVNLTGITRIEAAFDSPSGSGDTRGRYNGANAGNTRTGTGSGYSDIYNGTAITVTSVGFGINQNGTSGTNNDIVSRFRITDSSGTRFILDGTGDPYSFSPDFVWSKTRSHNQNHFLFDTVRGAGRSLRSSNNADEKGPNTGTDGDLISFNSNGFTLGAGNASGAGAVNNLNQTQVAWAWDAGTVGTNEVGDYWSPPTYQTKYIGFKFPTSSGGRAVFGLIAGTGTADIYTSSDNSSWTRVQQNVTLSTTDTTYDSTSQYLIVVNTTDAVWANRHYAMATSGTDAHYSTATYPGSGASFTWSGPGYTDWDFRSSGTVIKPGGLNSSVYDQSQTWSSAAADSYGFDGSTAYNSAATRLYGTSTYHKIVDADNPFTNVTSVVVGTSEDVGNIKLDGTVYTTSYTSGVGLTVTSPPSSFSDIEVLGASNGVQIAYVKVSGVILVDSGVSLSGVTQYPSIASTVRANPTAGFSIVTATQGSGDSTWGHGLNKKPDFVLLKARKQSYGWYVSHSGLDNQSTKFLQLNSTNAVATNANWFASTEPTSNVVTTKAGGMWNNNDSFLALCWTAVEGYSAFGSYQGNGSLTNGSFVFLDFTPALVIIKNTASSGSYSSWGMWDSTRNINAAALSSFNDPLWANRNVQEGKRGNGTSAASGAENTVHLLSNGFQVFGNGTEYNNSGVKYVYAAWAENPFKTARAR